MDTNLQSVFKKVFWIAAILLLVIMPYLSKDYGQTGDEDVEILYGIDIYNYYANGDQQALDYSNKGAHQQGQHFYGGFFNLTTEVIHRIFPKWHIIDIRHFSSAIMGALMMIFTGLFAYRFTNKNWIWGLIAMLAIVFSPRLFGESMNNGKDIPFAFGFIMGMYYFTKLMDNYFEKISIGDCIGLAIGWAVALGARSANALLFVAYIGVYVLAKAMMDKAFRAYIFDFKSKAVKRTYLFLVGTMIVGYFWGLIFWPYGLNGPISNVLASLEEMSNRSTTLKMLFDGETILNQDVPGNYLPKWISMSSPLIIIILYVGFYITLPLKIKANTIYRKLFLVFASIFPIAYLVYNNSSVLDTWRHMFFIYPFIVCAAMVCLQTIQQLFEGKKVGYLLYLIPVLGLLPTIAWTFKEHPNQYVYFNESIGGLKNALGYYEVDYYGHSGKASANWILKEEKGKQHNTKVIVRGNLEGLDYYFKNDTSWVDYGSEYVRWHDRGNKDWDYYISYTRFVPEWQLQNGKWPPTSASYKVDVAGTPIGFVIKRKSKDDFHAFLQFEAKNFDSAVSLYQKHLTVDSSNEYVLINYAIALLNTNKPENVEKAKKITEQSILLNPSVKSAYEILSFIYGVENDQAKAEYYKNKADSMP